MHDPPATPCLHGGRGIAIFSKKYACFKKKCLGVFTKSYTKLVKIKSAPHKSERLNYSLESLVNFNGSIGKLTPNELVVTKVA